MKTSTKFLSVVILSLIIGSTAYSDPPGDDPFAGTNPSTPADPNAANNANKLLPEMLGAQTNTFLAGFEANKKEIDVHQLKIKKIQDSQVKMDADIVSKQAKLDNLKSTLDKMKQPKKDGTLTADPTTEQGQYDLLSAALDKEKTDRAQLDTDLSTEQTALTSAQSTESTLYSDKIFRKNVKTFKSSDKTEKKFQQQVAADGGTAFTNKSSSGNADLDHDSVHQLRKSIEDKALQAAKLEVNPPKVVSGQKAAPNGRGGHGGPGGQGGSGGGSGGSGSASTPATVQAQIDYCKSLGGKVADGTYICSVGGASVSLDTLTLFQNKDKTGGKIPAAIQKFLDQPAGNDCSTADALAAACKNANGKVDGDDCESQDDFSRINTKMLCEGGSKNADFAKIFKPDYVVPVAATPVVPGLDPKSPDFCSKVRLDLAQTMAKDKDADVMSAMTAIAALKMAEHIAEAMPTNKKKDAKKTKAEKNTLEEMVNKMSKTDAEGDAFKASLLKFYQTYGDPTQTTAPSIKGVNAYDYFKGQGANRIGNESSSAYIYYLSQHPKTGDTLAFTELDAAAVWAQQNLMDATGKKVGDETANRLNFSTQVYAILHADAHYKDRKTKTSDGFSITTDPKAIAQLLNGPDGAIADLKHAITDSIIALKDDQKIACFKLDDGSSCKKDGDTLNIGTTDIQQIQKDLIKAIRAPAATTK